MGTAALRSLMAATAALLMACGGGGGSSGEAPAPAPAPAAPPAAGPAPAPPPSSGSVVTGTLLFEEYGWFFDPHFMNLDGSDLRERVTGAARRLRFPIWSPDGDAIALLAAASADHYDRAIYVHDMQSGEVSTIDLVAHFGGPSQTSRGPNGPLNWTR